MTERVDFYVLKSATERQRFTFACRLTEKAYLLALNVVLLSDGAEEAETLDEMLWTFNERSFVPHDLRRAEPTAQDGPSRPRTAAAVRAPVQLTPDLEAVEAADLLVNLSARLPARLERFTRIAEIIDADAPRRAKGRERYKAYRELNLPVETHQLDDAAGA
jgi:DNA polymerase-3 subunit chi